MVQDFLPEIICIQEQFATGGKCVYIGWGAVLLFSDTTYV
jgi:hypothetical protein